MSNPPPTPEPDSPVTDSGSITPPTDSLSRRRFVARLRTAAIVTPLAVAAIMDLPKVRADY